MYGTQGKCADTSQDYAIEWYAGNDDSRLRYYDKDDQRGFFYMSYVSIPTGFLPGCRL